jgi:hypothetical protein
MTFYSFKSYNLVRKILLLSFSILIVIFFQSDSYGKVVSKKEIKKHIYYSMGKLLNNPKSLIIDMEKISVFKEKISIKKVEIKLKDANFDSLNIDDGFIVFKSLEINKNELLKNDHIKIIASKKIDLKVEISELSLDNYVKAKSKKIKVRNPRIRLNKGRIHLFGTFVWKIGRISFNASGKLDVKSNKIYFRPSKFKINRMNLPGYLIRSSIKKINPILDMEKFPFNTELKYIKISEKKMIISSFDSEE